ncbi:uncharacterized protein [Zea mays]|uniref:uncharacterized protein n=1 Tax=Zea mays TaxID=4577 RepID=UPI0009A99631|nr:uncharacterized protein LOC109939341 [Zea mays]|eukprot:XP_020393353.1 uncharacterized protein LOC109939341 [Zea mays]
MGGNREERGCAPPWGGNPLPRSRLPREVLGDFPQVLGRTCGAALLVINCRFCSNSSPSYRSAGSPPCNEDREKHYAIHRNGKCAYMLLTAVRLASSKLGDLP